jgi:hypothetical protein
VDAYSDLARSPEVFRYCLEKMKGGEPVSATRPCKVIHHESPCLKIRSPNYHIFRPAGKHPFIPTTSSNKSHSAHGSGAVAEFDDHLLALEKNARFKYLKYLKSLTFEKSPRWFDQMLDRSLLPALHRIGFDRPISEALFKIALSSWKLMGPQNGKTISFHPLIDQQIEEVLHGFELNASKNGFMTECTTGALPQIIPGTIKNNASPQNLFDLLDKITTPWIILPRSLRFLKRKQCWYLPVYLKTIDRENVEPCLKLFSRIAVEFMGNYTLKFADTHHPIDKLTKLLFYGYSTLFWKTLRCPPENLENCAAFDNYFRWICRLVRTSTFLGPDERATINRMIKMKSMIFPARNFSRLQIRGRQGILPFMVTLRHGFIGIVAVLKYIGIDQFLETRQIGNRFACQSVQDEVFRLLQTIQAKYHLESKQTRANIKLFIGRLESAYAFIYQDFNPTEANFLNRIFDNLLIILSK